MKHVNPFSTLSTETVKAATSLQNRIKGFCRRGKSKEENISYFTFEQFVKKLGEHPVCHITTCPINLLDIDSWVLDHIVPVSKGGDNSIDNCGLCLKDINSIKSNLTQDQFIKACKMTLEANGFKVVSNAD